MKWKTEWKTEWTNNFRKSRNFESFVALINLLHHSFRFFFFFNKILEMLYGNHDYSLQLSILVSPCVRFFFVFMICLYGSSFQIEYYSQNPFHLSILFFSSSMLKDAFWLTYYIGLHFYPLNIIVKNTTLYLKLIDMIFFIVILKAKPSETSVSTACTRTTNTNCCDRVFFVLFWTLCYSSIGYLSSQRISIELLSGLIWLLFCVRCHVIVSTLQLTHLRSNHFRICCGIAVFVLFFFASRKCFRNHAYDEFWFW